VSESTFEQQEHDGRADFDFFIGSWKVRHRCLQEWLKGSTSWEEFVGTSVARKILGGLGHIAISRKSPWNVRLGPQKN